MRRMEPTERRESGGATRPAPPDRSAASGEQGIAAHVTGAYYVACGHMLLEIAWIAPLSTDGIAAGQLRS